MKPNLEKIVEFVQNEEIQNISSYKTSGQLKGVFYPKNEKELIEIYSYLKEMQYPFKVIGNGSNLLISDKTDILFISTKKMHQEIRINDEEIYFSASTPLSKAYFTSYENSLSGFEALAGIPATIGGALHNNASAFGQSIFDILVKIKVYKDKKIFWLKKEDISHSYHYASLDDYLILAAKFRLGKKDKTSIKKAYEDFLEKRTLSQPKGFSCGSVFKNPPNNFAGQLIENCGLKGQIHGKGQISEKHANFIINLGNATFDDIYSLIKLCQKDVLDKFGIKLETEVEIIN